MPKPQPTTLETSETRPATPVKKPAFGEPRPTADPTTFIVRHPSDGPFYNQIDAFNKKHGLQPLPFPPPRGSENGAEPILTFEQVMGDNPAAAGYVSGNNKIVFHATGDCGSVRGPRTEDEVVNKMLADFNEADNSEIPQFHFLLGDIVYSFGEVKYYYDQFYEPYRDYPAPILAAAGNHDGMKAPDTGAQSLDGYLRNFCADTFEVMPEAGGLSRTAQIQPGVFFTFEAPFVTIICLYSNALEDPGVISGDTIGDSQLVYLRAALTRLKQSNYQGALIFAHHHPAFTLSRHGWSIDMQTQIDQICDEVGMWPHADLAGHAHNYQRFTRYRSDGTQIPYVVCGNGGHNVQRLSQATGTVLRAPQIIQHATKGTGPSPLLDQITFENYDDTNYGYLRVIADAEQLRIEYHPASDGTDMKTPDDFVTVNLGTRTITQFNAPDLGRPKEARQTAETAAKAAKTSPPSSRKTSRTKKTSAKKRYAKRTHVKKSRPRKR